MSLHKYGITLTANMPTDILLTLAGYMCQFITVGIFMALICYAQCLSKWQKWRTKRNTKGQAFHWRPGVQCTHTRLMGLCPELPGWAGTRKVKPIWILLKQDTVSSSGISWAICKSAPCSRQSTMPVPHHSVFYRPDALPAAQPTASKHCKA